MGDAGTPGTGAVRPIIDGTALARALDERLGPHLPAGMDAPLGEIWRADDITTEPIGAFLGGSGAGERVWDGTWQEVLAESVVQQLRDLQDHVVFRSREVWPRSPGQGPSDPPAHGPYAEVRRDALHVWWGRDAPAALTLEPVPLSDFSREWPERPRVDPARLARALARVVAYAAGPDAARPRPAGIAIRRGTHWHEVDLSRAADEDPTAPGERLLDALRDVMRLTQARVQEERGARWTSEPPPWDEGGPIDLEIITEKGGAGTVAGHPSPVIPPTYHPLAGASAPELSVRSTGRAVEMWLGAEAAPLFSLPAMAVADVIRTE